MAFSPEVFVRRKLRVTSASIHSGLSPITGNLRQCWQWYQSESSHRLRQQGGKSKWIIWRNLSHLVLSRQSPLRMSRFCSRWRRPVLRLLSLAWDWILASQSHPFYFFSCGCSVETGWQFPNILCSLITKSAGSLPSSPRFFLHSGQIMVFKQKSNPLELG